MDGGYGKVAVTSIAVWFPEPKVVILLLKEPPPSSNNISWAREEKTPQGFQQLESPAAPNAPAYIAILSQTALVFWVHHLEDGTQIQQQITLPSIATFGPASLDQQPGIMESRHIIDHSDHQHQQVGFRVQPTETTSSRQQLTSRADRHHHTPTAAYTSRRANRPVASQTADNLVYHQTEANQVDPMANHFSKAAHPYSS
ncbi:hypothetical protein Nepgr_025375 [Nepenthes gracilis]|uniref:Uncharacterized protein n=1 Tax=Nepenthes gracilis TaxID=150966 RepID=A0AAD3XZG1_NEPGR|nr:hypothetical protein Nepgr_025375 [Nepenthes gracilis]